MPETAMERIERAINETFGQFFRSPNLRYYRVRNDSYAFAWTTSRANFNGKLGFWTLKYQVMKGGTWRVVKATRFGRRAIAKRRAYKWYAERRDSLEVKANGSKQQTKAD